MLTDLLKSSSNNCVAMLITIVTHKHTHLKKKQLQ